MTDFLFRELLRLNIWRKFKLYKKWYTWCPKLPSYFWRKFTIIWILSHHHISFNTRFPWYFEINLHWLLSRTFTKAKKFVLCAEYPMSSKSHLSKWKTYFSQFIEKFLKIQEVEYLINYVKFKMWLALFSANSLFLMLDLNVALGLSNFSHDKRDKKMEFSRLDPVW